MTSGENEEKQDKRMEEIGIIRQAEFQSKSNPTNYEDHDIKFIFGDLNFRVDQPWNETI